MQHLRKTSFGIGFQTTGYRFGTAKSLAFPPGYGISKMIVMMMGVAGSIISKKYPKVMKGPWGAGFCKDGYLAISAGSKVIAEVVSQDTRPHHKQEKAPERLSCFDIPRLVA